MLQFGIPLLINLQQQNMVYYEFQKLARTIQF